MHHADRGEEDAVEIERMAADLSELFLLALERLTCEERSVYLLRRCFGLGLAEVAPIVGTTETECSRIERYARRRLAIPGPETPGSRPGVGGQPG